MHYIMIESSGHPLFEVAWSLYERAFPKNEKRTKEEQSLSLKKEAYTFMSCFDKDVFVGILSFWKIDACTYIEHFAIDETLRGQNYGSKLLSAFLQNHHDVYLEIEMPTCEMTKRRLNFYKNLGFVQNAHEHYQIPFRKDDVILPLQVLSYQNPLSKERYDMLYKKMYKLMPLY